MDYGLRLKEVVLQGGLKQKDIALELGVHPMTISRWMGMKYPDLESIERICEILGVPLSEFFGGSKGDRLVNLLKEIIIER